MDNSYPTCRVIALVDGAGTVRHVEATSARRAAPWRIVWDHREELPGRLAAWFRTLLDHEPAEIVLLGGGAGLTWTAARNVARLLNGWFPACAPLPECRRIGRREEDGSMTTWPTRSAAAKALGVHVNTVDRWVRKGKLLYLAESASRQAGGSVCRVDRNGHVTVWPTQRACAKSLGISTAAVSHRIDHGTLLRLS